MTAPLLLAKPFDSGKLEARVFVSISHYHPSLISYVKFKTKLQWYFLLRCHQFWQYLNC
jgi:hypothetical protein